MDSQLYQREVTDGVVVSAGYASSNTVVLHTANKKDAEWIYKTVDPISSERHIEKTEEMGFGREYYLNNEGDILDGYTKPIYQITFVPTEVSHQRMLNWTEDGITLNAPRDFQITPTIAKMIYRVGAHEMKGRDNPYIEFNALGSQRLQAELQNLDIRTTKIDDLWRMDEESSAKFREYAGIDPPNGGD